MKNHIQIAIQVAADMEGIGGMPTDQDFYSEFCFRLSQALGLPEVDEKTELASVPYQRCPICTGEGRIPNRYPSVSLFESCPTCKGDRIIPQHIVITELNHQ